MFSTKGLFSSLSCPNAPNCKRDPCPYSHKPSSELPKQPSLVSSLLSTVQPHAQRPVVQPLSSGSTSVSSTVSKAINPSPASTSNARKRPAEDGANQLAAIKQPPKKVQKIEPTYQTTSSGVPRIQSNAAKSNVPIAIRQTMLATLYEQFRQLYASLLPTNPSLPGLHALAQEEEVYAKSNKTTYRNAMISAIASIKKRPLPDSKSHPSVGTISQVTERVEKLSSASSFRLTRANLSPFLLSRDDLVLWDFMVEIPPSKGGERPNEVGNSVKCERCLNMFVVKENPSQDECTFHWARAYTTKVDGVKETLHRCCSQPSGSKGCEEGVHVFYEKNVDALHSRHAFSLTSSHESPRVGREPEEAIEVDDEEPKGTTLDVVAMDCEMIYTTAGMSVARVSVVDGKGEKVLDELVRMSEGVEVLDFNTRFSGVTSLEGAVFDLEHIRKVLRLYIGPETIIVGHALDNDLKTLRMVHTCVVDTCALYRHKMGPPYRRALRDLAREYLGANIQTGGGTTGHSSLEDARATLDLVKCWVMERTKTKPAQ